MPKPKANTLPEEAEEKKIDTLVITCPNKGYEGITFGVKFDEGQAVVSRFTKRNKLGYSLEQLHKHFTQDIAGYEVQVYREGEVYVPPQPELAEEEVING